MKKLTHTGVDLAYDESGSGDARPMVFIHGWGCDHSYFAPQLELFRTLRHTVTVDLRGHGASDAPYQVYTVRGLADDLAWQCRELGLADPILVGHSMGGQVALECAACYPDRVGAVVLIDSVLFPPVLLRDQARALVGALEGPEYLSVLPGITDMFFLPSDAPDLKAKYTRSLMATPQHVLVSSLLGHIPDYDATDAASGCRCPIAYIGSEAPFADLVRFRELCPSIKTGQTIGSGHFSPLMVPEQINTMLQGFERAYVT